MMRLNLIIRKGHPSDLNELQQLFADSVKSICNADYDYHQINVWVSSINNVQRWIDMIENQLLLVALEQDKVVGFCSLENNNYIDMLYVHKDKQRKGIARELYKNLESVAIKKRQKQITSDVSITARPFFEKLGFTIQSKNAVIIQKVGFTNYKMTKSLL